MNFVTFFDKNYISRGLVLINSISQHEKKYKFYIIALDQTIHKYFNSNSKKYPNIICLSINEIENVYPELEGIKKERKLIEYYFTLSPLIPLYILKKYNVDHICSLDADIKFYSSPKPIFNYLKNHSIIITPHKFSSENKKMEQYGKFNVSFQIFKNNQHGLNCLEKWKKQCIEWCKDEYDYKNYRYADQKYLDTWPIEYNNEVKILDDSSSGLAVWNANNYDFRINEKKQFISNGEKVIFYHFHYFRNINKYLIINGFERYNVKSTKALDKIYIEYWENIKKYNFIQKTNPIRIEKSTKTIEYLRHKNMMFCFFFGIFKGNLNNNTFLLIFLKIIYRLKDKIISN